jgi:acetyl esterase/lipase
MNLKPAMVVCFTVLFTSIFAQYELDTNINYRESQQENLDSYQTERCILDVYYPSDITNFPTIVWFHSGGIQAGEKYIPEQLKEKGIAVVAVNYRLHPKVKSPEYIYDAAAAVAWTFKNIENYGGSKSKIVVSGHSAGGYLASMVGLDKKYLDSFNIDADEIAALVPFSGHTITHFTVRKEHGIPGEQPIIDEMAPLFHVRKDCPPYIQLTGDRELELLGRYEENAYMYRMMKVVGHSNTFLHELDGHDHGAMANPAFHILLKCVKEYASE